MKQILLKTIVIVVDKLTRSRVLRDGARLCEAPRSGDKVRQFSPSCGVERGWGKIKPYEAGVKTPSFGPTRPITIPTFLPFFLYYRSSLTCSTCTYSF